MTKSATIRALAKEGLSVAEIARRVGVRYQHAYNVLKQGSLPPVPAATHTPSVAPSKPTLTVQTLIDGGFRHAATWTVADDIVRLDRPLPKERGVYAFVIDQRAMYVGLATMGLAKRLYFYGKPGVTQRTSLRLNETIQRQIVEQGDVIDVYVAMPPQLGWNGLPVSGDAGLELGLIQTFHLPWNVRGAG